MSADDLMTLLRQLPTGASLPVGFVLKSLEDENRRLKRLVADLTLDKQMLQDVLSRKW